MGHHNDLTYAIPPYVSRRDSLLSSTIIHCSGIFLRPVMTTCDGNLVLGCVVNPVIVPFELCTTLGPLSGSVDCSVSKRLWCTLYKVSCRRCLLRLIDRHATNLVDFDIS